MTSGQLKTKPRGNSAANKAKQKRNSRAMWEAVLKEFEGSDLSVVEFCAQNRLSACSFYRWRQIFKAEKQNSSTEPAAFIPVQMSSPEVCLEQKVSLDLPDSGLSLVIDKSLRITIDPDFHSPTLQRLVQLLASGNSSAC